MKLSIALFLLLTNNLGSVSGSKTIRGESKRDRDLALDIEDTIGCPFGSKVVGSPCEATDECCDAHGAYASVECVDSTCQGQMACTLENQACDSSSTSVCCEGLVCQSPDGEPFGAGSLGLCLPSTEQSGMPSDVPSGPPSAPPSVSRSAQPSPEVTSDCPLKYVALGQECRRNGRPCCDRSGNFPAAYCDDGSSGKCQGCFPAGQVCDSANDDCCPGFFCDGGICQQAPTDQPSSAPSGTPSGSALPSSAPTNNPSAMPSTMPSISTLPSSAPSTRWEQITYDDFENGWGNFGKVDKEVYDKWGALRVSTANSFGNSQATWIPDGTAALRIRGAFDDESSVFLKNGQDVTAYSKLRVSFMFAARSMESGEGFVLEYSANGGTNWTTVKDYVHSTDRAQEGTFFFPKNDRTYADTVVLNGEDYDLDTSDAKIRFRCDASNKGDFIYIDDVLFEGYK